MAPAKAPTARTEARIEVGSGTVGLQLSPLLLLSSSAIRGTAMQQKPSMAPRVSLRKRFCLIIGTSFLLRPSLESALIATQQRSEIDLSLIHVNKYQTCYHFSCRGQVINSCTIRCVIFPHSSPASDSQGATQLHCRRETPRDHQASPPEIAMCELRVVSQSRRVARSCIQRISGLLGEGRS
jgi:hypothetical protein